MSKVTFNRSDVGSWWWQYYSQRKLQWHCFNKDEKDIFHHINSMTVLLVLHLEFFSCTKKQQVQSATWFNGIKWPLSYRGKRPGRKPFRTTCSSYEESSKTKYPWMSMHIWTKVLLSIAHMTIMRLKWRIGKWLCLRTKPIWS